jgi:hypothetical protein
MSDEYYTIETVKFQMLQKGRVDPPHGLNFPPDWNYCPCVIVKKCEKNRTVSCSVSIGIFFNDPNIKVLIIEIIYLRENHHGFIRANHMQLNKLIEKGIINRESLEKVSF